MCRHLRPEQRLPLMKMNLRGLMSDESALEPELFAGNVDHDENRQMRHHKLFGHRRKVKLCDENEHRHCLGTNYCRTRMDLPIIVNVPVEN